MTKKSWEQLPAGKEKNMGEKEQNTSQHIERPSQKLSKPLMWCRIGASHWRFLQ
jgi:hypothetical protein